MSFLQEYHPDSRSRFPLRPTRVIVHQAALKNNLRLLAAATGCDPSSLMPVVKANGYGHGILNAARGFLDAGAGMLAVGFVEEGIHLRREGIDCPILVLGGLVAEQIPLFLDYDLQVTVSSLRKAEQVEGLVSAFAPGARLAVHLKVDCDMERIGVHVAGAGAFVRSVAAMSHIHVAGIYSHFAMADAGPVEAIRQPLERFLQLKRELPDGLLPADCRWHMANSAAAIRLPESRLDMIRPGIQLYGIDPAGDPGRNLLPGSRPALSWISSVVYFKVVPAGAGISYGHLYHTNRQTRIVTVPVGYGDGYGRAMTGKAEVLIRGRRYPVVGAICMDQLMVDIGPDGTAYNGDEVVLIGSQGEEQIRVEDLARWQNTIPYEILTSIAERVPREVD